jgi:hypothetical protein
MKLIRPQITPSPFVIADNNLTSSNVSEGEYTAYTPTPNSSYVVGDKVQVVSPTSTITISIASPCVITWTKHQLPINTAIRITTTGALPTGLTAGTIYYVKSTINNDSFYITDKPNGANLITSGTQSGTHTAVATRHDVYEAVARGASSTSGSISGTVMTIGGTLTGVIAIGMNVHGTGGDSVTSGTYIVNQLTGTTGGLGTYTVSISQTVTSTNPVLTAPVTNSSYWIRVDSTNKWRMHDSTVSSQTSNITSIANVYQAVGRMNAVILMNINAITINVTMTDTIDGVVYNQTYSGVADSGIQDMYSWYFEPIIRITDLAITDLPQYTNSSIAVTLTATGETVLCGACVLGNLAEFGFTQYGMGIGIQDYSVKQRDTFGNYSILERSYNKRATMSVFIKKEFVDFFVNTLAGYRATPIVYIGSDSYGSSIIFGFYKDFNVEIQYPDFSLYSLELEGLI